jgi:hypothetical protein
MKNYYNQKEGISPQLEYYKIFLRSGIIINKVVNFNRK